jgi:hypothetical protein
MAKAEGTRERLEQEFIAATLSASNRILSCAILNHIIQWKHLIKKFRSTAGASIILSLFILFTTALLNRIVRVHNSFDAKLVLITPASITGLAFFMVKWLHDSILPENRVRLAKLPYDEDGLLAIQNWFKRKFSIAAQIACSLLFGIFAVLTLRSVSTNYPSLSGNVGLYVGVFLAFFAIGNGVYCALVIPTLASAASKYRMNLYPYDPASTIEMRFATASFGKLALANGCVAALFSYSLYICFSPVASRTYT